MKRRAFIKTASTISVPVLIGGWKIKAIAGSPLFQYINGDSDKVLVLIQLNGGNDGLNTITPLDQYDQLFSARPNIIIPENSLLPIDSNNGLHPVLTGIKSLYDDAKVNIIQSVGYPNQNRSHFRSSDIWFSASDADEYVTSGWFGRYLQDQFPDYPEDYPNEDCPHPMAITIGPLVSETCQGLITNFSMAVPNLDSIATVNEFGATAVPDNCYGEELVFIRNAVAQTNAYAEVMLEAADLGGTMSTLYDEDNPFAQQLKTVAHLIAGGLRTKIFVVSIGGFDTHALQVEEGDPAQGGHATLLNRLSDGMQAFQDDLRMLGLGERVISMTFSEFGRRIRSNDSLGTDHGTAAPMFVFGECVNPGIIGTNPQIADQVQNQEGVPMQYDFRSMYGTVLMDWFGVPEDKIRSLLYEDFQRLEFLDPCDPTSTDDPLQDEKLEVQTYPNPFVEKLHISFHSRGDHFRISLFDVIGHEIKVINNEYVPEGQAAFSMQASDLASGNYYLRIADRSRQKTVLVQKLQ